MLLLRVPSSGDSNTATTLQESFQQMTSTELLLSIIYINWAAPPVRASESKSVKSGVQFVYGT